MNHLKHRAFLKWAGGKYRLVPDIQTHLPKKACLVEPFVGAGSVFLNTDFEHYLLADINPDLINLFNIVKADVEQYIAHTKLLFLHPKANNEAFYKARRAEFNRSKDVFRRSVIFLYLNRFGYNGLCRYNRNKHYNVPFGRYKTHYFPEKELRFFAEKAQKATFICADFEAVFDQVKSSKMDCVIYCDPPYAPLVQESNFTQYASGGFSLMQQTRLALLAQEMKEQGVPVLISNHNTEFTRQIYGSAQITEIQVQRSISQNPASRIKVGELFALFM